MIEREARERITALGLQPHPEGGFYRETYRSPDRLSAAALPPRYGGERCYCTAILFLLPRGRVFGLASAAIRRTVALP